MNQCTNCGYQEDGQSDTCPSCGGTMQPVQKTIRDLDRLLALMAELGTMDYVELKMVKDRIDILMAERPVLS